MLQGRKHTCCLKKSGSVWNARLYLKVTIPLVIDKCRGVYRGEMLVTELRQFSPQSRWSSLDWPLTRLPNQVQPAYIPPLA